METVYNHFRGINERFEELAEVIIDKTVFDIVAEAQDRAPVQYGALKNSIHGVTSQRSTETEARSSAKAVNPDVLLLDEQEVVEKLQGAVGVAVHYGFWVHEGTSIRGPRPFLAEAVETYREPFLTAMARAIEKAGA